MYSFISLVITTKISSRCKPLVEVILSSDVFAKDT